MGKFDNFKNIKTGSGNILKPEDGKSYKIRFIGEPWVYTSEFQGNPSVRFALTIYNQTESEAQILMLSRTAFATIYDLSENEDWGDPEDYDITMKRTGEGTDTKYTFAPSPKTELDPDKKAEVESIVLDDVLSRLPSVQQAFPLSAVNDMDQLLPKQSAQAKTTGGKDIEVSDEEMPEDFLT